MLYKKQPQNLSDLHLFFSVMDLWNSRDSSALGQGQGQGCSMCLLIEGLQLPCACSFCGRWQKHKRTNQTKQAHLKLPIGHGFYPSSLAKASLQQWGGRVTLSQHGATETSMARGMWWFYYRQGVKNNAMWTIIQFTLCMEISNLFSIAYRSWNWLDWIFPTLLQTFHWTDVKIVTQTSYHVRSSMVLIWFMSLKR